MENLLFPEPLWDATADSDLLIWSCPFAGWLRLRDSDDCLSAFVFDLRFWTCGLVCGLRFGLREAPFCSRIAICDLIGGLWLARVQSQATLLLTDCGNVRFCAYVR